MPTLTPEPLYPAPNRPLSVRFALAEPAATYVRVWCTDAPAGSKLKADLTKCQQSRLQVYEGDGGAAWTNGTFDKGGTYRFKAQEYTRFASDYGGSYEGDPDAAPSMTKVGSEADLTLSVGQRMTCPIGFNQDKATLVVWVWDDKIRATTVGVQGELTPAILSPQTPRATSAATTAAVISALADMDGITASSAVGTLSAWLDEIVSEFNDHLTQGSVHATSDTDNAISEAFVGTPTPQTLPRIVSEVLSKMRRHFTNDDGSGVNSDTYHSAADWENLPLFTSGGSLSESYAAIADIYRAYEAHRVSSVHNNPDTANDLATPEPKILVVHREFLRSLAALSPTVPATQSVAAVTLMQQAGFTES